MLEITIKMFKKYEKVQKTIQFSQLARPIGNSLDFGNMHQVLLQ